MFFFIIIFLKFDLLQLMELQCIHILFQFKIKKKKESFTFQRNINLKVIVLFTLSEYEDSQVV